MSTSVSMTHDTKQLIKDGKSFAILMPASVTSEIARLENKDGKNEMIKS